MTYKKEPLSKSLRQLRRYDRYLDFFRPTLDGYHYKFSIFLPINEEKEISKGNYPLYQIIFTREDLNALQKLFVKQFKGSSQFRYDITYTKRELKHELRYIPEYILPEMPLPSASPHILGSPKLKGSWVNKEGKPVVNEHVQYYIYTQRHNKAVEYFRDLKEILEIYSKEKIILIEQSEVTIVSGISTDTKQLLRKIKRLEEENRVLRRGK